MTQIDSRKLKEIILKSLAFGGISQAGIPGPRQAHKINLIGRPYQRGDLESSLDVSFTPETRVRAAQAFDELKRDGFIVPTYADLVDPENWVEITEAGIDYLNRGLPEKVSTSDHSLERDSVPKLTLDTNCIINLFDLGAKSPTSVDALSEIMRYGLSGKANVAITTRVEADLLGDRNAERKEQMLRTIALLPIIGTVARYDVSKWDGGDVYAGPDSDKVEKEIQGILFPGLNSSDRRYKNKQMDIDHLVGHIINRRDVFVTDDTDILKKRDALKISPGINVMTPADCVSYLDKIEQLAKPKSLRGKTIMIGYHSAGLKGRVIFDYSNNNGSYAIGDGLSLFETKWSKASDTSIHAYSDGESINSLALAKGVNEISEVSDTNKFDYSSRVRTVHEGQIVIWKNTNGLFAATKVVDIKDDTRGDKGDELTFEYSILPNGDTTFVNL